MKILYLHGLNSNPNTEKLEWLKSLGFDVLGPFINYSDIKTFNKIYKQAKDFNPDLIIGSSAGGYIGYLIGNLLNIDTILFNPALHSRTFNLPVNTTGKYKPKHNIFLGKFDSIINPIKTEELVKYLDGNFSLFYYSDGHRVKFKVFKESINKILKLKESVKMKHIKEFNEYLTEETADGLLQDIEDDGAMFDIDIEIEDEDGNSLDDDPEETGDYPNEKSRPPRIKKKQRKANAVKGKVTKKLLGPDSKLRPVINKIFKKIEKEIKIEARKQKVPIGKINLDRINIKR